MFKNESNLNSYFEKKSEPIELEPKEPPKTKSKTKPRLERSSSFSSINATNVDRLLLAVKITSLINSRIENSSEKNGYLIKAHKTLSKLKVPFLVLGSLSLFFARPQWCIDETIYSKDCKKNLKTGESYPLTVPFFFDQIYIKLLLLVVMAISTASYGFKLTYVRRKKSRKLSFLVKVFFTLCCALGTLLPNFTYSMTLCTISYVLLLIAVIKHAKVAQLRTLKIFKKIYQILIF